MTQADANEEAVYGLLINMAGQLRILSHRSLVFCLLADRESAVDLFNAMVSGFAGDLATLSSNNEAEREDSKKYLSESLTTIEKFSSQVRLIALNAAIEAARAGSAGAAFSVIAKEVRDLSSEVQDAATNMSHVLDTVFPGRGEAVH